MWYIILNRRGVDKLQNVFKGDREMKKLMETAKKVPKWGWWFGFGYFALQYGMYRLGDFLSMVIGTKDFAHAVKIAAIDDLIPVIPVFALIYLFSYIFWICGPISVSLTGKRNFVNYLSGLTLAYFIGFLIFTFYPTYMDRAAEGLMDYSGGGGFFDGLLAIIYAADGSELAFNLFPSYHCLISVYCYLGVRKREEVSKGFRVYTLVMTILICLSTVFTKQHYIIDTFGGLAISILCYMLMQRLDPGKRWIEKHEKQEV